MPFFTITRLILTLGALLLVVQCQVAPSLPAYSLSSVYDQRNFFAEFRFFTAKDPTHGFVEYVDGQTAEDAGLAGISEQGGIFMGVDCRTQNPINGRKSVRLTSAQAFTHGLFVADIAHMPSNACGVWPAFWMFGNDWPDQGEIDIIEGVSNQLSNQVTLHTNPGCSFTDNGGALLDCSRHGCGQEMSDATTSYGDRFNANGGGVYATEWTSSHIAVWFFPRSRIPADVTSGMPDPSSWAAPMARFDGGQSCNLDEHFRSNNLVFDTTFCGAWAGTVWASDGICSNLAPTCEQYVGAHPEAFSEAYWLVNSVKVYNAISKSNTTRGPASPGNQFGRGLARSPHLIQIVKEAG